MPRVDQGRLGPGLPAGLSAAEDGDGVGGGAVDPKPVRDRCVPRMSASWHAIELLTRRRAALGCEDLYTVAEKVAGDRVSSRLPADIERDANVPAAIGDDTKIPRIRSRVTNQLVLGTAASSLQRTIQSS
jgi:hypothetical protein